MTPFKLCLTVAILPPVESILHALFRWQAKNIWCTDDIGQLPMVVMASMAKSPAVIAMNKLVRCFVSQCVEDDMDITSNGFASLPSYMQIFLHLHKGLSLGQTSRTQIGLWYC